MDRSLTVSVVIPTYNRLERLRRVLAAMAEQRTDAEIEVVVVSDGSTDGTDEYLATIELARPLVAITQENAGPAAARNQGVESASGELVVFIDDDVVATPDLVEMHVSAHRRLGDDAVVIGPMLDPPDHTMSPWVRWEQAMLAKQYRAMLAGEYAATARQFYTGNASIRRAQITEAGGFDPAFRRAEDVELAYRLADRGLHFRFVPEAVGYHYAERSYASWRANAYAYGRNDVVFARDLGQEWLMGSIIDNYRRHHRLARTLTRQMVPRPRLASAAERLLKSSAALTERARLEKLTRAALSSIYSTEYHRGTCDELGGPDEFERVVVAPSRQA